MTQVTGNSTDPFSYLEAPDDAWWSHNAFQFAIESWLPSVFHDLDVLEEATAGSDSCLATIDRIVRGCLENRMHMFSLLAASSGFMKFVLRLQLDRHDTPEYCMGKALQHLRHHLAASDPQPNESLIFDLMALSTFERYVNNFEGARTHFRMVQHLVRLLGGLGVMELPMRLLCWLWDLLVAGCAGETPLLPLTWDPGSLPQQRMQNDILPDLAQSGIMPSGSGLLEYGPLVHRELTPIIGDTVQWFQVQQYNYIHNFFRSSVERWATKQSHALVHRLLSVSPTSPGDPLQGVLSECIKQSILNVIAQIEAARRSQADTSSIRDYTTSSWSDVNRLYHSLSMLVQSGENWQTQHGELVLWMACLGVQQTVSAVRIPSTQSLPLGGQEDDLHAWFVALARQILDSQRREGPPAHYARTDELVQVMNRYIHRCEPSGRPSVDLLEVVFEA
ncbi:hypothetical protein A1O7_05419 [Cladophialophora yegresii CBS 114405]|uniref:Transcription factor domain-containing protein n=1 Tax=Cladophialophora yegresii CBS 114405 TaxID=1182544 RepID=W9W0G8_9EURO|nr:uncharacterized protein A1O7_05419 [Cladophialophora yegresii CBS 114405]EXJ57996.1 hypothetical protein A1O7_05419 [Cladophialophora yegresii CBS 114405]